MYGEEKKSIQFSTYVSHTTYIIDGVLRKYRKAKPRDQKISLAGTVILVIEL